MLRIARKLSELSFSELMRIYIEGNQENGKELYPDDTEGIQLRKVEEAFYQYLTSVFFHQKESCYMIWVANGRYQAALRLEPYQDGYLLSALETAPETRRKGYATNLIKETLTYLSSSESGVLYSHVSKRNAPSLAIHRKCGFQVIKDYAVYSDGSVLHNHLTFAYVYEKSEI